VVAISVEARLLVGERAIAVMCHTGCCALLDRAVQKRSFPSTASVRDLSWTFRRTCRAERLCFQAAARHRQAWRIIRGMRGRQPRRLAASSSRPPVLRKRCKPRRRTASRATDAGLPAMRWNKRPKPVASSHQRSGTIPSRWRTGAK
jgi:hypothetical protein